MTVSTLLLGIILAATVHADSPLSSPSSPSLSPSAAADTSPVSSSAGEPDAWRVVEDARGTTGFAQALDDCLRLHPHGVLAARALLEQAEFQRDLTEAGALLRRAAGEALGSDVGASAKLALARLEFAEDKPDLALHELEEAEAWPRVAGEQAEWLYWRGQCRMSLRAFQGAAADFASLLLHWPQDARAAAALLDEADCEAALKEDGPAAQHYAKVAGSGSPFAAQALWGLGCLRERQALPQEAREDFQRLISAFPASFEAEAAPGKLDEIAAQAGGQNQTTALGGPLPKPGRQRWSVHVGAYGGRRPAEKMARHLRRDRFKVSVRLQRISGRLLYIVKVGPISTRAKAEAVAQTLSTRERVPVYVVQD